MADDIKDTTGADDSADDVKDTGAGTDAGDNAGDKGAGKPEPQVPISRLRQEADKREALEKELAALKSNVPEEEKRTREILTKLQKEEADKAANLEKEWTDKMTELKSVHGEFNEENLATIIDEYGLYNQDGSIKWSKAMDLYNRLGGNPKAEPPKKKIPSGGRGGDGAKDAPADVKGKSMYDLAHESKQELS